MFVCRRCICFLWNYFIIVRSRAKREDCVANTAYTIYTPSFSLNVGPVPPQLALQLLETITLPHSLPLSLSLSIYLSLPPGQVHEAPV